VFSAYGEGLRRQILWDICRKAIREDVVSLDGTGLETRDFVHAADVAEAVAIVAHHAAFAGETFNVGTGLETSVGELARLLVGSLGVDREIRFSGLTRVGDPRNWRADISALRRLGFEPAVSIKAGAAAYAAWAERELATP
jgi:UDP-glucose 4-epimerase